ncbi:Hypothetical protein SRAE_2000126400 [Strongyloides ratti]|uniref:CAP domain-containing protein n=1 Tax=Strongyloides ratti TaxID=34506 RepID=A0A090L9Z4_STRRB|nr:Hypothetical protein SRAE_2000126400 [Strongyloides ratti]CEF66596.1 Hypothetical protein SRAE_2000126400 [Strongyloides ratti]
MDLKILTIVLIYFASQTHEYVYFSVPFYQHFNNHSSTYEYRERIYSNLKFLMRKISLDFPDVPYESILLKREFITYEDIINDTRTDHRYIQVQKNGRYKYIILPLNQVMVEFFEHDGRRYYACNKSPFTTYRKARINCELLEKYSSLKSQHRLLGKDFFAGRIWRNNWRDCYYKCFSETHFLELKKRFLKELVMLRNIYNKPMIFYNKTLEFTADYHARINALVNKLLVAGDEKSKVHEVAAFISPPFANLQLNKWYNALLEERRNRNNNIKRSKLESKQFYLLLSSRIREVGFGVYLYKQKLSIVLTFM